MPEIFDVVDHQDRVIGQAPRHEVHARGLRHRAVHILVFDEAGALFVQKRAATKDTFPLRYDSSASGHVNNGEQYDEADQQSAGQPGRLSSSTRSGVIAQIFPGAGPQEAGRAASRLSKSNSTTRVSQSKRPRNQNFRCVAPRIADAAALAACVL